MFVFIHYRRAAARDRRPRCQPHARPVCVCVCERERARARARARARERVCVCLYVCVCVCVRVGVYYDVVAMRIEAVQIENTIQQN